MIKTIKNLKSDTRERERESLPRGICGAKRSNYSIGESNSRSPCFCFNKLF